MNNLSFSDFAIQAGGGTISDGGKFLKINKTSGSNLFVMAGYKNSAYYLTPVLPNTTYTITYVLRKSSNFVPQSGKRIILRYRLNQNDVTNNLGELMLDSTNVTDEFTTYTKTFTTGTLVNPNSYYFQVLVEEGLSGEIELSYEIKLERGSTATPYQPNLLDAPYYLSKAPLGENIASSAQTFPIVSSSETLYGRSAMEDFIVGQTYVVTMKATKPATQSMMCYLSEKQVGTFNPVEGLTNVWTTTIKINQLGNNKRAAYIMQTPNTTLGVCQIDWLKIEKGDTRTPNISEYKYRGIGMRDSNNPKDYVWDLAPEYVEDNLATDIKISEITGKANNYTDGKVSEINSQLTASINEVDTTAKDAQTKANANETAIKSTNSRVNEIENIITALTKEETYLLPASIVSGGSLKFTSRGGMTVATGSFKLAKDIAFGEVLVNDLPDSMINIDNNAIGTGAVTGNSVSQIYVESNTRKVVANTAMKKDQWFTVGFSYHSKLSI
ncbi:TPA: hypothetical protein LY332_002773 [Enterococcus faecium]|nr:hypothetical protein [Enterococcus faecium]